MSEDETFTKSLKYITIGVVVIVIVSLGSCQMTNYHIQQAIEAGSSPIEARCALSNELSTNEVLLCERSTRKEP